MSNKEIELIYIYANWCGHCKNFMNSWENIDSKMKEKNSPVKINTKKIDIDEVPNGSIKLNGTEEINGFPTLVVKLSIDGKNKEYDLGKYISRDENQIMNFMKILARKFRKM